MTNDKFTLQMKVTKQESDLICRLRSLKRYEKIEIKREDKSDEIIVQFTTHERVNIVY